MTIKSRKLKKLVFSTAPLALLAVAACTTPFRADVSRFQQLPAAQGQSFVVLASDPELQGGIEFGRYANLVEAEMVAQGYRPASNEQSADLLVRVDYDVDTGRERVYSYYSPFYGHGFGHFGHHGFHRPYIFGHHHGFLHGGYGYGARSYTVYTSELDLKIERAADRLRLFEGTAEAQSRSKDLGYLVPNLIEAMFTGFPGNSGERVLITVAPDEREAKISRARY